MPPPYINHCMIMVRCLSSSRRFAAFTFFCATTSSFFNFWFSSFQRVNHAVAAGDFLLHIRRALVPGVASMLFSLSVSVLTWFSRSGTRVRGWVSLLSSFQRDPGGTAVAIANLRVTGAVVRLQYRHFFPALMVPDQTIIIARAAGEPRCSAHRKRSAFLLREPP